LEPRQGREAGEEPQEEAPAKARERGAREKIKKRERKNIEGREKELPNDSCVNLENCRDLSIKHNFSLI
jgi:hypothetical protein